MSTTPVTPSGAAPPSPGMKLESSNSSGQPSPGPSPSRAHAQESAGEGSTSGGHSGQGQSNGHGRGHGHGAGHSKGMSNDSSQSDGALSNGSASSDGHGYAAYASSNGSVHGGAAPDASDADGVGAGTSNGAGGALSGSSGAAGGKAHMRGGSLASFASGGGARSGHATRNSVHTIGSTSTDSDAHTFLSEGSSSASDSTALGSALPSSSGSHAAAAVAARRARAGTASSASSAGRPRSGSAAAALPGQHGGSSGISSAQPRSSASAASSSISAAGQSQGSSAMSFSSSASALGSTSAAGASASSAASVLTTPPISPGRPHVTQWESEDVRAWLGKIHCEQYADRFEENGITGEVLPLLDDDALKDMGVLSVGQRLHLLNAIYKLKEHYGLPIQDGDYIPLSEEVTRSSAVLGALSAAAAAAAGGSSAASGASLASMRDSVVSGASIPLAFGGPGAYYAATTGGSIGPVSTGAGTQPGGSAAHSRNGSLSSVPPSISFSGAGQHGGLGAAGPSGGSLLNTLPSPWHIAGILREKDERIRTLEHEVNRLGEYLSRFQQDFVGICRILNVHNALTAELPPLQPFMPLRGMDGVSAASQHSGLPAEHSQQQQPAKPQSSPSHQQAHTPTSARAGPGSAVESQGGPAELSFSGADTTGSGSDKGSSGLQYANVAVGGQARAGDPSSPTDRTPVSARLGGAITHGVGGTGQPPSFGAQQQRGRVQQQQQEQQQQRAYAEAQSQQQEVLNDAGGERAAPARSPLYPRGGEEGGPLASPTTSVSTHGHSQQSHTNPTPIATPTSATHQTSSAGSSSSHLTGRGSSSAGDHGTTGNSTGSTAAPEGAAAAAAAAASGSSSKDKSSSDNPYKSFRVTLDDPCHKVLPAALKKYKINDDWKQYALFICYGNTERCLSYDEKPLLLFQKLKESKQNPVFMLRNIKDVKSPIAIANAKAEARGLQSGASRVAKKREQLLRAGADQNTSIDVSAAGQAGRSQSGGRSLPPVNTSLSIVPGITPAQMSAGVMQRQQGMPRYVGPAAALPKNGLADPATRTYAVAIYPYASERDDEFDVAVGDTYIVLSKAKGWWIVQGDCRADGSGDVEIAQAKAGEGDETQSAPIDRSETEANGGGLIMESGWVPAGCLLEVSRPLLAGGAAAGSPATPQYPSRIGRANTSDDSLAPDAAAGSGGRSLSPSSAGSGGAGAGGQISLADISTVPISPSLIISTSTPGVMLMDFSAPDRDLVLKRDDRLRVFKRYNHWSYCVKEGTDHARGWVPSWFIGKATSSKPPAARAQAAGPGRAADPKASEAEAS